MIIVSNTSPISNLAAIGELELLHQLYGRIIIPTGVYQEIINSGNIDPAVLEIQTVNWIEIRHVTNSALVQDLKQNLDTGESEAITLAIELSAYRLIMDEKKGRNQAINLGIRVIGILGILLAAKHEGLVSSVKPLLDSLINQGFWIGGKLYQEILSLSGE